MVQQMFLVWAIDHWHFSCRDAERRCGLDLHAITSSEIVMGLDHGNTVYPFLPGHIPTRECYKIKRRKDLLPEMLRFGRDTCLIFDSSLSSKELPKNICVFTFSREHCFYGSNFRN